MDNDSNLRNLKLAVSSSAALVAAAHLIWPYIAIDGITLGLLVVAVIPWLAPLVKSVELPGGLKVELQEIQKAAEKAKEAGLLEPSEEAPKIEHTFLAVAQNDPNLALAGFRIEIERRLVELCERNGISTKNRGLGHLLRSLDEKNVLTPEQRSAISDLTSLLNSATHGAKVEPQAAQWALDIAPELLDSLTRLIGPRGHKVFTGENEPRFAHEGDLWEQ
ncbi:MAG TPA: hypothetical protein VJ806_02445 [Luteimonas sp.]|nr:hypothetical protein [Luteimonas sp.]